MRTVEYHKIKPSNDTLDIVVCDDRGHGGANYAYKVEPNSAVGTDPLLVVNFQKGPIAEHGINGVTQEILLAIVIDRLRSFQSGPFSSRENAIALTKCEEALHWLQQRTLDGMRRGGEGRSIV